MKPMCKNHTVGSSYGVTLGNVREISQMATTRPALRVLRCLPYRERELQPAPPEDEFAELLMDRRPEHAATRKYK